MIEIPESSVKRMTPGRAAVLLAAAALVLRLGLLVTTQKWLGGDEAVVAIMAKHIGEGRGHPLYFYGQGYMGGASVEAHAAALAYRWFGVRDWAAKLVPLTLSLSLLGILWVAGRRLMPPRGLLFAFLFLAFSPSLATWNLSLRGWSAALFLQVVLALGFLALRERPGSGLARPFGLGLLGAAAYWASTSSLPLLAAMALVARGRLLGGGLAGFSAGIAPILLYDLGHAGSHLGFLERLWGHLTFIPTLETLPGRFLNTFAVDWPAAMATHHMDNFADPIPAAAWYGYALALAGLARLKPFLLLYVGMYLAAYILGGFVGLTPRYLLPLTPFALIAAGLGLADLWDRPGGTARLGARALLAVWLGFAALEHGKLIRNDPVVDGVFPTHGASLPEAAAWLERRGVRFAYATYFVQWRLLFYSGERVIVSSDRLWPRVTAYPAYEAAVERAARFAYVVNREDPLADILPRRLRRAGVGFRRWENRDYAVFWDLSRPVRPRDLFPG